ncbi:MAG TPA: hypothetical protein VGC56_16570 [Allosphingosinicella sp.]|jgi:hypothetical protein
MNIIAKALGACAALALVSGAAVAQPAPAAMASTGERLVLKSGTEVPMKTIAPLSSKVNRQGDRFDLVVAEDVRVNGALVIPRGSRGVGEITHLVHKGAFGRSGKLDTRVLYVTVGDTQVKLDGHAADKGKSGTAGTVAVAVVAGVFSAFVTGKSAVLPSGSTMMGYVQSDMAMTAIAAPSASPIIPASAPAPH